MSNRWFRFVIALLAIAAAAAAGFRIFQHERQLVSAEASSRAGAHASASALSTILEIKAALHAYVAPGQGHDVWIAQVDKLLDALRASILELDSAASSLGMAATDALDLSDRLAASEQRARNYARAGQSLLAGEVIFTDARDLLASMRLQIARVGDEIAQATDRREAEMRQEQAMLGLGAAAVLALAVLVLVPPGRTSAPAVPGQRTAPASAGPVASEIRGQRTAPATTPAQSLASFGETSPKPATGSSVAASAAPVAPAAFETSPKPAAGNGTGGPVTPVIRLSDAAAVCTDLGRVSQSNEISALLERAAKVLSASGVIVWISSENRDELFPAASSGYDDRLFDQIRSISRDEANLTSAAFRAAAPRTTTATTSLAAALAVPLLTPQGPIGVFSAELRELPQVDADRLALATIFAAQLANLLGSTSIASAAPEHQPLDEASGLSPQASGL